MGSMNFRDFHQFWGYNHRLTLQKNASIWFYLAHNSFRAMVNCTDQQFTPVFGDFQPIFGKNVFSKKIGFFARKESGKWDAYQWEVGSFPLLVFFGGGSLVQNFASRESPNTGRRSRRRRRKRLESSCPTMLDGPCAAVVFSPAGRRWAEGAYVSRRTVDGARMSTLQRVQKVRVVWSAPRRQAHESVLLRAEKKGGARGAHMGRAVRRSAVVEWVIWVGCASSCVRRVRACARSSGRGRAPGSDFFHVPRNY